MLEREVMQERKRIQGDGVQLEEDLINLLRGKCQNYYKACDQKQLDKAADEIYDVLQKLRLENTYHTLIASLDKERGPPMPPLLINYYE